MLPASRTSRNRQVRARLPVGLSAEGRVHLPSASRGFSRARGEPSALANLVCAVERAGGDFYFGFSILVIGGGGGGRRFGGSCTIVGNKAIAHQSPLLKGCSRRVPTPTNVYASAIGLCKDSIIMQSTKPSNSDSYEAFDVNLFSISFLLSRLTETQSWTFGGELAVSARIIPPHTCIRRVDETRTMMQ